MQDFFLEKFSDERRASLIAEQKKVIDFCVKNTIPIIVLEYATRGETTKELNDVLKKSFHATVIKKENNSGFRDTNLDDLLKNLKINKLLLMGINGTGCVQDTAIGALKRGYSIFTGKTVIASSTKNDANHKVSEKWYSKHGPFLEATDEILKILGQ